MTSQAPTILLTRPVDASKHFVDLIKRAGIALPVLISPAIRISCVSFESPSRISGAIFTSVRGVENTPARNLPAWCVGAATTKAALEKGWNAFSADGDAEALLAKILSDSPKGPLVHFRGKHARGDIAQRLCAQGIETTEIVVYKQDSLQLCPEAQALLMGKSPVILPLFSPKTAATVAEQGPFNAPIQVVAISPATAEEARPVTRSGVLVARTPDANAMVAAINHVVNVMCFVETDQDTP